MNWLRRDHHYGFPWKMGDTDNPQQFGTFNPATDKLINHFSRSWRLGFFTNDPGFPLPPAGVTFDSPIQNFGPDCDKYRDTSGMVLDASDSSVSMGTFTAHRSPLGLVFDNAHLLSPLYNGDAFMLSWTKGYDSCGCSTPPDTSIGPFVDPSQDLVHLDLAFDSIGGNYRLNAKRIISDFQHPVDAEIDSIKIYVIENGYGGTSGLYEVTLPAATISLPCNTSSTFSILDDCIPDSNYVVISAFGTVPNDYYWYESSGILISSDTGLVNGDSIANLSSGSYYVVINDDGICPVDTLNFIVPEPVSFHNDSVSHTTCIGCNDGVIYYSLNGGWQPVSVNISSGILTLNNSIVALAPGQYLICAIDDQGCTSCDSATILEDPTDIALIDKEGSIILYPNPTSKTSELRWDGGGETLVRLLDINGKQIKLLLDENIHAGAHEMNVDCSGLAQGSYAIEIVNSNGTMLKKLLIFD